MTEIVVRRAAEADLPAIVALLADDSLGATREDPGPPPGEAYRAAFAAVDRDPNQLLVVVEHAGRIAGTLQLSFIPGIARRGAWRGQIEAVRVARDARDAGVGRAAIEWAIGECRRRGCALVQLTSDRTREDAHRFYERLGFAPSHVGFKRPLGPAG